MTDPTEKSIRFVPGLEERIRLLAEQLYGVTSKEDSIEELTAIMLPELVENALAGDMEAVEPDGDAREDIFHSARDQESELPDDLDPEIRHGIEEAARALETPAMEVPLEVKDPDPERTEPRTPELTFEHLETKGRVHPDAILWAKGSPAKEAALIETCLGMAPGLWGISKMPSLVERTWNLRTARHVGEDPVS